MTIKSFNFVNDPLIGPERNWREFDQNSKFGLWTPSTSDITEIGSTVAYYQLYGAMVYYYIHFRSNGDINGTAAHMNPGATPQISNLPYGPETPSGLKTIQNKQWLSCLNSTGTPLNGQFAQVTTALGTSYIQLPTGWTNASHIYIQGWVFRDR